MNSHTDPFYSYQKHPVAYAVHKAKAGLCGECALEVHVDATGNRNEGGRARGTLDVPAPRGWDNFQFPWQFDASVVLRQRVQAEAFVR